MPTFFKKTTSKKSSVIKRKFAVRSAKPAVKKVTRQAKTENLTIKLSQPDLPPEAVKEGVTPTTHMNADPLIRERAHTTLKALDSLLQSPPPDIKSQPVSKDDDDSNAIYRDDEGDELNGVSHLHEQQGFYREIVDYERKRTRAIEEQVKLLEKEKDDERKTLQKEIRALKEELHRTTPLHENKFFTLSKELRTAIVEIERIAGDNGIPIDQAPAAGSEPAAPAGLPVNPPVTQPVTPRVIQANQPSQETNPAAADNQELKTGKKSPTKTKLLITGASTAAMVIMASAIMSGALTGKAKVDQKLVDSYMDKNAGQIQGTQTTGSATPTENDPSQADVSFEQSVWEEYKDANFGVLLQYPKNSVKPVRTDSSVTFIRKTGYLFKVQRIETALTLEEYWKQIKATSLKFELTEEKFKGKPALKLVLQDIADYPGDRYLVKEGDFIYDIWYATPSNNFAKDDILRAEKMLASLSVIGVN